MNEVIKWQGNTVEVQARLVPRFLWNTASIDVFLEGQRILRTGGQLKFTGSRIATFSHSGSIHTAELNWGFSGFSFSLPYRLQIDGVPVAASRVRIQNWPLGVAIGIMLAMLLFALVLTAVLLVVLYFIHATQT